MRVTGFAAAERAKPMTSEQRRAGRGLACCAFLDIAKVLKYWSFQTCGYARRSEASLRDRRINPTACRWSGA